MRALAVALAVLLLDLRSPSTRTRSHMVGSVTRGDICYLPVPDQPFHRIFLRNHAQDGQKKLRPLHEYACLGCRVLAAFTCNSKYRLLRITLRSLKFA